MCVHVHVFVRLCAPAAFAALPKGASLAGKGQDQFPTHEFA